MKTPSLFFICYCVSLICFSQNIDISFKPVYSQNEISNVWVRSIFQDKEGFMWIGTSDGLNRYDGNEYKIYRPKNKYDQEIGQIQINDILEKSDNELWICTSRGMYIYDYLKDDLIPDDILKKTFVLNILQDSDANIWFATDIGLFVLEHASGKMKTYTHSKNDPSSLSHDRIISIFEDSDKTIWVGTENGLNKFDKNTQNFTRYYLNSHNSQVGRYVIGIQEDDQKRLWIGTPKDGLFILENKNSDNFKKVSDGFITNILIDSEQILWVTNSSGYGINIIHTNDYKTDTTPTITTIKNTPGQVDRLNDNSCFVTYEDYNGDIWVGTYGGGLSHYSKRKKGFHKIQYEPEHRNGSIRNNLVTSIYEEEAYIWYGTDGGLDQFDKQKGTYTHFEYEPQNPKSIGANPIFHITRDSDKNLWIGTWNGGLNRFDYDSNTFEKFKPDGTEKGISSSNVFSLIEHHDKSLFIGTIGGGLNRFSYDSKTFTHFRPNPNKANSIISDYVESIYQLSNGDIYLISHNEIQKFDPAKELFYPYFFNLEPDQDPKLIKAMYEDHNHHIWVASNIGLYIFNEKEKTFTPYEDVPELKNKSIEAIIEDDNGNLWLSTNQGLFEIINGTAKLQNPVVRHYTEEDGLSGNEFNKRAVFKNESGKLYFGSSKGVTWFYPDQVHTNDIVPEIVFTEFQLLSDTEDGKKFKSTKTNVNYLNELKLSYKTSDFSIKFAALNYLNSEKNQYKYKLEGHNEDWIDAEGSNTVTYTNIPPGNYTFKVMGSNNDGLWNPTPKELRINISAPWWKTLLFKGVLALLIGLLIFAIYRIRFSFLKKQNQLLEQKVKDRTNELKKHQNHLEKLVEGRTKELQKAKMKAEESDRLKSAFLRNMSHEIRTPMNAIYGFSNLMDDPKLSNKERLEYISIVKNNCDSLLLIIDSIIDMSLIEANHTNHINEEFDVHKILSELEWLYRKESTRGVTVNFTNDNPSTPFMIISDQARFRQIFTNLLSNAIKFTTTGSIDFGYEIKKDSFQFYVSDTGIGIPHSEINTIFDVFYKIVNTDKKSSIGTGIGLAICKKLVEQLKGKIWVTSAVNEGSTFYFSLPRLTKEEIFIRKVV